MWQGPRKDRATLIAVVSSLSLACGASHAALDFEAAQVVQASGVDLVVGGYSVPSLANWNEDGLPDLLVGEGGGTVTTGKVRVYLNSGSPGSPGFDSFNYVQAGGVDLAWPASGCQGVFPRVVQWDGDGRKDLVVGLADGRLRLYTNIATNAVPAFDAGVFLLRSGIEIDVGYRATPLTTDWNADDRKDLVVGAVDGRVRVYLNEGTDDTPLFVSESVVQCSGADLIVPSGRSSPCRADLDGDGCQDLLTGNTDGQLLLYRNHGSDPAPVFLGFEAVTAMGVAIDLDGTPRSRPSLCDWNADARLDVLVGAGDGMVRLYLGRAAVAVPDGIATAWPAIAAYPNPFNPMTTIRFDVPEAGRVRLSVYDVRGKLIRTPLDSDLPAGTHQVVWDGRDSAGRAMASGGYFARLEAGGRTEISRMSLVR